MPPAHLLATAAALAIDVATAEAVAALADAGCESIVLRGPAIRDELYRDGAPRSYGDADLLVAPADLERAGGVLAGLGYELVLDHRGHATVAEPHAQEWRRSPRESIDLHWRLAGVDAPPERGWAALRARARTFRLGGRVEALRPDRAGIALIVAVHAAHHGETVGKPLEDLRRALDLLSPDDWRAAADLARELDATAAMRAGLSLDERGPALATELSLPAQVSARRRLMASDQPPGALGLLRLLDARTGRLRLARETLFPRPEFMFASHPTVPRTRRGLALAHARRLLARGAALPRALRAVRNARRPS